MVAMSEGFGRRWECERERREIAELIELAKLLIALFGDGRSNDRYEPGMQARPPGVNRAASQ